MHRIDGDGNVGGLFDQGDPLIPTPATQLTADWANAVQEELVYVIQTQGGVTLNKLDNGQLWSALVARFGRLGANNTWTGNQSVGGSLSVTASTTLTGPTVVNGSATFNTSIVGTANAVDPSGMTMPTKFVFQHGALANTTGQNYPMVSLTKFTAGNLVGLNTRVRSVATIGSWTSTRTGVSLDVDGVIGAGGQLWFTPTGLEMNGATAATSGTPQAALALTNGYLSLDGVTAPASTTPIKNTLTPNNIIKAMVSFQPNPAGPIVLDAENVTSIVNNDANSVLITFAQPFASAVYVATYGTNNPAYQPRSNGKTASTLLVSANDATGGVQSIGSASSAGAATIDIILTGRQ